MSYLYAELSSQLYEVFNTISNFINIAWSQLEYAAFTCYTLSASKQHNNAITWHFLSCIKIRPLKR